MKHLSATLIAVILARPAWAVQTVNLTYAGSDGSACTETLGILIKEPEGNGPFPVHVHMVGTFANYLAAEAPVVQSEMVSRGFLSASLEYDSATPYNCSTMSNKASCLFNSGSPSSAISKICARPEADCSLGIIISGMSQGGQLTLLANNYYPNVNAAYAISAGNYDYPLDTDLSSCLNPSGRTLPVAKLRTVSGEHDTVFGKAGPTNAMTVRTSLQETAGLSCGVGAFSCFRADGSGWYLVQNTEVQDGTADHCYHLGNCGTNAGDIGWLPPATAPWSMRTNLSWLASHMPAGSTGEMTSEVTNLQEAYVYPNPAVAPANPVIRVVMGQVDTLEITIFDIAGRPVFSRNLPAVAIGTVPGGANIYEYTWGEPKASGVYRAVVHGRGPHGVIKARLKFAVVR